MRRHYNYNAPIYRELSARIVRQMAAHYGQHPAVIGWQIDNELNCEVNVFYSAADQVAFRAWAQQQIWQPRCAEPRLGRRLLEPDLYRLGAGEPDRADAQRLAQPAPGARRKALLLRQRDRFARMQAEILRELAPNHWITTNGLFGHLDSHQLTEEALDFISYDSYPNFSTILSILVPDRRARSAAGPALELDC